MEMEGPGKGKFSYLGARISSPFRFSFDSSGPINKVLSSSSSAAAAGKKWGTKVRGGRDPFLSPFYLGIGELGGGKNPAARSRRTDAFTKDSFFPDLFLPLFLLPF